MCLILVCVILALSLILTPSETDNVPYPYDSALTKRFVVKITVERCDKFLVSVPQIFDRMKFVALWSAKKKRTTICIVFYVLLFYILLTIKMYFKCWMRVHLSWNNYRRK
jgi:hypothetical protein